MGEPPAHDGDTPPEPQPPQPTTRRLPPRAKSAYYSRRLAQLPSDPTNANAAAADDIPRAPRPAVRRRASFASGLPDAAAAAASKPPLRRGATGVPRRSAGSAPGVGSKTFAGRPPLPTTEEEPAPASASAAPSPDRQCMMCGNCTELGMPPWAPERLAKMSASERSKTLLELRAREEAGRVAAEIRTTGVAAAQAAAGRPPATVRRPPKRQSTRLSAVLAPGNNSDARRQRAAAHAARQAEKPVKVMTMDSMESEENAGADEDATLRCEECDVLERQVVDLEEQLKVLREVAAASNGTAENEDDKKAAWHERVIGTFVGAPPGSETAKLKDEVAALRKATDILFAKLNTDKKSAVN